MRSPLGIFLFIACLSIFDFYAFQVVKTMTLTSSSRLKFIIAVIYCVVSIVTIVAFMALNLSGPHAMDADLRNFLFGFIVLICAIKFITAIEAATLDALRTVGESASRRTMRKVNTVFWVIFISMIVGYLVVYFTKTGLLPRVVINYIVAIIIGLLLTKFIIFFFGFIDDIRRVIQWLAINYMHKPGAPNAEDAESISRSVFLSWAGLAVGGGFLGTLVHGFSNKYKYEVKKIQLSFNNLPAGFKGLKIVQISDIHSGSFTDPEAVQHGVEKVLAENPDLILFTGDLVNDMAREMEEYIHIFSLLKAPMGVYSILGNHDYGDYIRWPQQDLSQEGNMENLKKIQAMMGWRLLMNEHVVLERGGDKIALLGIENWSTKARFPKHGRMDLAHKGTEQYPFKILMSHDPSHWEGQVQKEYPDVDLMLSGHTHGMQFGLNIPAFKWSPVQYMYKQWAGLYENDKQKLYVNTGFGFLGYPGRVGILPEITVIELV